MMNSCARVGKGVSGKQMIAAGQKIMCCRMKLSTMLILGRGGRELSRQHALNSASVASAQPNHAKCTNLDAASRNSPAG